MKRTIKLKAGPIRRAIIFEIKDGTEVTGHMVWGKNDHIIVLGENEEIIETYGSRIRARNIWDKIRTGKKIKDLIEEETKSNTK